MERKEWDHSEVSGAGSRGHSMRIRRPGVGCVWESRPQNSLLLASGSYSFAHPKILVLLAPSLLSLWYIQYQTIFTYRNKTQVGQEEEDQEEHTLNLNVHCLDLSLFQWNPRTEFIRIWGGRCGGEVFSFCARYKNLTFAYQLLHVLTGDNFYNLSVSLFETWDNEISS